MAQHRRTHCFSLLLLEESESSSWTACQVYAGPDARSAPVIEATIRRKIERTEELERSDRLDRWWQVFYGRYGPH